MKRILCFILILTVLASFSACRPDYTDEIIGKWEGTLDMTDAINAELAAASMNITVPEFSIKTVYHFKSDGTFTYTVDRAALQVTIESYIAALQEGVRSNLQNQLIQQGSSQTIDEYMAEQGTTFEDWFSSYFSVKGLAEGYLQIEKEGRYQLNADQLFLSDSADGEINEDKCEYIEIKGDTMKFVLPEDVSIADTDVLEGIDLRAFYPLTFQRIK